MRQTSGTNEFMISVGTQSLSVSDWSYIEMTNSGPRSKSFIPLTVLIVTKSDRNYLFKERSLTEIQLDSSDSEGC